MLVIKHQSLLLKSVVLTLRARKAVSGATVRLKFIYIVRAGGTGEKVRVTWKGEVLGNPNGLQILGRCILAIPRNGNELLTSTAVAGKLLE
jgi:hypothetical protein